MDQELQEIKNRLDKQDKLLQEIYSSVERTRRYFLGIIIASVILFIVPLVGLLFALPSFVSQISNLTTGL